VWFVGSDSDMGSLHTCDTRMEFLCSVETECCDQDLKMKDCGLDPKMVKDCGLDPNEMMDFVLFQEVCFDLLFRKGDRDSMVRFVSRKQCGDINILPPLSVILYNGRRNLYISRFCLRSSLFVPQLL
jgi:hypothetical protein